MSASMEIVAINARLLKLGAAMRLMTSESTLLLHMIGNRHALVATTVIILGRTRIA